MIKCRDLWEERGLQNPMVYRNPKDPRALKSRLKWYKKNKRRQIAQQIKRRLGFVDYVRQLRDNPCADCGGRFPPECMDFDHVRGKKKFNVSLKGNWTSKKRIDEEIAKCELVCANCHRVRTTERSRERQRVGRTPNPSMQGAAPCPGARLEYRSE